MERETKTAKNTLNTEAGVCVFWVRDAIEGAGGVCNCDREGSSGLKARGQLLLKKRCVYVCAF